jgi:predicted HTH transcriptional regulator
MPDVTAYRLSLDDLDKDTLQSYRNLLSANKTNHPWIALNEQDFLARLGGWHKDRETGEEGLTLAGLLMFGQYRPILEALPNYFLDYQELPTDTNEIRWLDRVVPDGTWSGNLLDFYRRVILKLEADLKTPFAIQNNIRQGSNINSV